MLCQYIFEPLWNWNYIDHVEITVAEEIGVEHRGKFYDKVGILRDIFQNHLLQLLTMVAMEPPVSFDASALRNEKVKGVECHHADEGCCKLHRQPFAASTRDTGRRKVFT